VFFLQEEKEKGMSALRQLEFQKVKIDKINRFLKTNNEKRMSDSAKIHSLNEQILNDQAMLNQLPEARLS
jgi:hypothetical protein